MPEDQTDRRAPAAARLTGTALQANPWHALWAMLVGFFMILVDSTIVVGVMSRLMQQPVKTPNRERSGSRWREALMPDTAFSLWTRIMDRR